MRQTTKDGPHMNSGGIALRHVQDVGQVAISIPPQWNMPIAEHGKKERRPAQRQAPVIVTGDTIYMSGDVVLPQAESNANNRRTISRKDKRH